MKVLSDLIKSKITDKMDHKNLNLEVDFLKHVITSAENIVISIYNELYDDIKKLESNYIVLDFMRLKIIM